MKLFKDLEACNQIIMSGTSTGKTIVEMADEIIASNLHPLVKYYAFKCLDAPSYLTSIRELAPPTEQQAKHCLIEIRNYFMRSSRSENQKFSELLTLFAEYYAGTDSAASAEEWAESLRQNQSWLGASFSLMLSVCEYAASCVIENPVKSALFLLLATAMTAGAKSNNPNGNIVEVVVETPPSAHANFLSTSDTEFKQTASRESIHELIAHKIKIDPDFKSPVTPAVKQRCSNLKYLIVKAMEREHQYHITRVLINPKFRGIYCSDQIQDSDGATAVRMAEFDSGTDVIRMKLDAVDEQTIGLISHEMMHADDHYRHQNSRCSSPLNRPAPLINARPENIKQWNDAFTMGDKRIDDFYGMWQKRNDGRRLTNAENTQFEIYEKALEGSGICHAENNQRSYHEYEYYQKRSKESASGSFNIDVSFSGRDFSNLKISSVSSYHNGQFSYLIGASNPVQSLFLHDTISRQQLILFYANFPPDVKLAEREAWTFMNFAPRAAKTFYPEVYSLRQKDLDQCATHDLTALDQHIKVALFFAGAPVHLSETDATQLFATTHEMFRLAAYIDLVAKGFQKLVSIPNWAHANLYLAEVSYRQKDFNAACSQYLLAHKDDHAHLNSHADAISICYHAKKVDVAKKHCLHGITFFSKNKQELIEKNGKDKVEGASKRLMQGCLALGM